MWQEWVLQVKALKEPYAKYARAKNATKNKEVILEGPS
jgi:hypothetical protein